MSKEMEKGNKEAFYKGIKDTSIQKLFQLPQKH